MTTLPTQLTVLSCTPPPDMSMIPAPLGLYGRFLACCSSSVFWFFLFPDFLRNLVIASSAIPYHMTATNLYQSVAHATKGDGVTH